MAQPLGNLPLPCDCTRGLPCNGATETHRRLPKHGGAVVTSRPDCLGEQGADYSDTPGTRHWTHAHESVSRCYGRGDVLPEVRARSKVETNPVDHVGADHGPRCAPAPTAPTPEPLNSPAPYPTWAQRRAARVLTDRERDAARQSLETTNISPPSRRSRRGTLNCTRRGAASAAVSKRDHYRSLDRNAQTAPLTGRERRAAKREAHRARLRALGGGATPRSN